MFSGLNIFFHLQRDPVFIFANNIKRIVLDIFSGKLGPGICFRKISTPPIKIKWLLP